MRAFSAICVVLLATAAQEGNAAPRPATPPSAPRHTMEVFASGRYLVIRRTLPGGVLKVLAKKKLPAPAVHLLRRDSYVFAACGFYGFVILDISRPTRPRTVASASGIGNVQRMQLGAGVLVVSVGRYRFRAFDVKDPANIRPLTLKQMARRLAAATRPPQPVLKNLPDHRTLGRGHLRGLPGAGGRKPGSAGEKLPAALLRDLPSAKKKTKPASTVRRPTLMGFPSRWTSRNVSRRKGPLRSRVLDVEFEKPRPKRRIKRPVRSGVMEVPFSHRPGSRPRRIGTGSSGLVDVNFDDKPTRRPTLRGSGGARHPRILDPGLLRVEAR